MNVGELIFNYRSEKKLTQAEFANLLHVSRQLVSRWETGKSYPDITQIVVLSDLFDISLDKLLREDKNMMKKINFAFKEKSILYLLLTALIVIFIFIATIFSYFYFTDSVYLSYEDIEITKIERKDLPLSKKWNKDTLTSTYLAEDVEYTIYFRLNKPFTKVTGSNDGYNLSQFSSTPEKLIFVSEATRSLLPGNKDGKIVLKSFRDTDIEQYNKNKNLYYVDLNTIQQNKIVTDYDKNSTLVYNYKLDELVIKK